MNNIMYTTAMQTIMFVTLVLWASSSLAIETKAQSDNQLTPIIVEQTVTDLATLLSSDELSLPAFKRVSSRLKDRLYIERLKQLKEPELLIKELDVLLRTQSGNGYASIIPTKPSLFLGQGNTTFSQNSAMDFGFEQVSTLPGNIGYIELTQFYQHQQALSVAEKALRKLKNTNALIIDVRRASGYSLELAQFILSYFFEHDTLLAEVIDINTDETWLMRAVDKHVDTPFKRDFPVYVLTSAFVTQAGEFLAYTLKHFDKAVIVGEQTMGVSNWPKTIEINHLVSIKVPSIEVVNPMTETNWEGVGVSPDYDIEAVKGLELAYELARGAIAR